MKRIVVLVVFLALITACYETSVITGTWKSPSQDLKKYNKILVTALTLQVVPKSTIETAFSKELNKAGLGVTKGINVFPPTLTNSDTDKTLIMTSVHQQNADALLTISLINSETETRYEGNLAYNPWGYPYYRNFWGYYSYMYPYGYNPFYYTTGRVYYIETNLYDAATENLIWSAQSETYEPGNIESFSIQFARQIVTKLQEDGIIESAKAPKGNVGS